MRWRFPSRSPTTVLIWARASRTTEAYRFATLRRKHELKDTVTIERRYRGPLDSGNGGYSCGRLAAFLDGPAEVTLRLPPPLDRPLGSRGATARRSCCWTATPSSPRRCRPRSTSSRRRARRWPRPRRRQRRHVRHRGGRVQRVLHVRRSRATATASGSTSGRSATGVHAAPWTARDVSPEVVWAAIDCPGAFAVGAPGPRRDRARADGSRAPAPAGGRRALRRRRVAARRGRTQAVRGHGAPRRGRRACSPASRQTWIAPRRET